MDFLLMCPHPSVDCLQLSLLLPNQIQADLLVLQYHSQNSMDGKPMVDVLYCEKSEFSSRQPYITGKNVNWTGVVELSHPIHE